jgi:hypothetical protein
MSDEKKTYSLRTSAIIVAVLVGIICAISYFVAVGKQQPADAQTEKHWAGELERAFLSFDGVQSARVEGTTTLIDFAVDKTPAIQKETALKAAHTAADVRLKLKLDPKVTVVISVKGKPQYQLVYTEPQGVVEEKMLEPTASPDTNAPKPAVQTAP